MKYEIDFAKRFWKSPRVLKSKYTNEEYSEIIDEIKESILILAETGSLPVDYDDHVLVKTPYFGFNEYHLYDDDVLIIYHRFESRKLFHFVEVTDHEHLTSKSDRKL